MLFNAALQQPVSASNAYAAPQASAHHLQALAQQQAYFAQQQAHAQRQAYVAQQQASAHQRAYFSQQQAYVHQQAFANQQSPQQPVRPALNEAEGSGDLISAASVHFSFVREADQLAEKQEEQASGFGAPAAAPGAFVFVKPGQTAAEASQDAMRSSSDEFAAIMDAKMAKARKKNGRSFIITLILFFGPILGATGWFVSNPARVEAFRSAVKEIRSVGDIQAILANYQKSLDKVAVRSQQIDEATSLLGIDPATAGNEDPYMDKEMKEMTGPDGGPTIGDRNKRLREKFGDVKNGKGLGSTISPQAK